MRKLILITALLLSSFAQADVMEDFDSLGGNDVLLEKAQAVRPETRVQVVQDRIVERRNRHEFNAEYQQIVGGYSYLDTNAIGANYQYHINPHWSLGAKYSYYTNKLSPEGDALVDKIDDVTAGRDEDIALIPELDWPLQSYMALVNWYPIYGKMNLYDLGILHFDIYLLGGYGQVQLEKSGDTPTYTAGGGMGMWFSQHLTGRLEVRYQTYDAESFTGKKSLDLTALSFNLGYML
jgi:outer membrane beta-barrel protein